MVLITLPVCSGYCLQVRILCVSIKEITHMVKKQAADKVSTCKQKNGR